MVVQDDSNSREDADSDEQPSKSQRKRDADAIRALGEEISELPRNQRDALPLPDDVRQAVEELQRIHQRGARKRQLGFLAKKLRAIDLDPVLAVMEQHRMQARREVQHHHRLEAWRDRLLGLQQDQTPQDALTALLQVLPGADSQRLRQLQRQALKQLHQQADRPEHSREPAQGNASRELFREIRRLMDEQSSP